MLNNEIIEAANLSIKIEMKALQSLLDNSTNQSFCELINLILNTKGKVCFSAVGKPGYIAHKCAATFASTGTPSFYLHPTEASHGDLGMIDKKDLVILLSNSGSSNELRDIILYCKRNGITLVTITRNKDSFVSQAGDLSIVLENVEQTNPVNSPTSDIIMFLAYLDAVATVLIKAKGFNQDNFKKFHPGGKLGANLIKVDEIMHVDNLPLVYETTDMREALDEMIFKNLGCVGVLDTNSKKLIGIITDGDLKRLLKRGIGFMEGQVKDAMTLSPRVVKLGALAVEAASIMSNKGKYVQVLFVVDDESHVVGFLHVQDLFKAKII